MENIWGFIGSHWMPPSGNGLCHISPVATMVSMAVRKKKC